MVGDISAWIKNIILIVLFATFLELLLPHSNMRSFVRVIMGLFIMLSILQPVIQVLERRQTLSPVPALTVDSGKIANVQRNTKQAADNREQIVRDVYCKDLAKQINATVSAVDGVADSKVEISLKEQSSALARDVAVDIITVYIKPGPKQKQIVSPVSVQKLSADSNLDSALQGKVHNMITQLYQLPGNRVVIKMMMQGGSP